MIILTGGAGFIGSAFLWRLNEAGITDVLVSDELDSTNKWKNLSGRRFIDYIEKDDLMELIRERKLPKVSFVVHMGACSDTTCTDARYFIKNNYEYSKSLVEWAVANEIPFMYASSAATYGDGSCGYSDDEELLEELRPLNMYAFSKQLFDLWVKKERLFSKVTGLKFFNVFGPGEYHKGAMRSLVCKAFPEVQEKGRIKLFKSYREAYGPGEQRRDFIYIKDAVEMMYFFFKNPALTGIYNLGTGEARSWNDLAGSMFKALGREGRIDYIDMPEELRDKYQYFTQADISKLRRAGYDRRIMSLEEAVGDYISHYLVHKKAL